MFLFCFGIFTIYLYRERGRVCQSVNFACTAYKYDRNTGIFSDEVKKQVESFIHYFIVLFVNTSFLTLQVTDRLKREKVQAVSGKFFSSLYSTMWGGAQKRPE